PRQASAGCRYPPLPRAGGEGPPPLSAAGGESHPVGGRELAALSPAGLRAADRRGSGRPGLLARGPRGLLLLRLSPAGAEAGGGRGGAAARDRPGGRRTRERRRAR